MTSDNATNNNTMMAEFANHINDDIGKPFDPKKHCLRQVVHCLTHLHITNVQHCSCLAHIINLATQALLAAHSKSKHYDPTSSEDIVVATRDGFQRDKVGLIRVIAVKVGHPFDNCCVQTSIVSSELRNDHLHSARSSFSVCSSVGHVPHNPPLQLMLDMKVRWSSLFVMLHCALDLIEASTVLSSDLYYPDPFSPLAGDHLLYSDAWNSRARS